MSQTPFSKHDILHSAMLCKKLTFSPALGEKNLLAEAQIALVHEDTSELSEIIFVMHASKGALRGMPLGPHTRKCNNVVIRRVI
jgi:hypothetical protein